MKNVNIKLPDDPLSGSSIEELGSKLRNGSITCFELTTIYYRRINILNSYLHAYIHLDENLALSWAEGIDKLFKSGVDLVR